MNGTKVPQMVAMISLVNGGNIEGVLGMGTEAFRGHGVNSLPTLIRKILLPWAK